MTHSNATTAAGSVDPRLKAACQSMGDDYGNGTRYAATVPIENTMIAR
jgi:hypothetical protein